MMKRAMDRVKRWHVGVLSVLAGAVVVSALLGGGFLAAQTAPTRWPPQFPREGATKLFENDHVIVWEQVGRPQEPFAHRHIRDILTFGVEPGKIEVTGPNLEPASGPSGFTESIYRRGNTTLSYSRAGLGPHVELAPDPNAIPISIFDSRLSLALDPSPVHSVASSPHRFPDSPIPAPRTRSNPAQHHREILGPERSRGVRGGAAAPSWARF